MARKTLRTLLERPLGSEWKRLVRRVGRSGGRVLLFWNRGLGDIALGLARVVDELRREAPQVRITIVTRADLAEAFALLPVEAVVVDPQMKRQVAHDARGTMRRLGLAPAAFDLVLARPDPTHWFRGRPTTPPCLRWPSNGDRFAKPFDDLFASRGADAITIGVHVRSETAAFYRYRKDWPVESWRALFARLASRHPVRFVLFGHAAEDRFDDVDCIDLRGRTSFLALMAVIKNHCRLLIAPDSGILTMMFYLGIETPIDVVSLWADPRQGVLKDGLPSPNPLLRHRALVAPNENIEDLAVDAVDAAIEPWLDEARAGAGPEPTRAARR